MVNQIILATLGFGILVQSSIAQAETQPQLPHLPFLKKVEALELKSNQPVKVQLQFESGWALNPKAPSGLAMIDLTDPNHPQVIQEYRGERMTNLTEFKPLAAGKNYRLRGTIYFCEKSGKSGCRVASRDWSVAVSPQAKASNTVEVRLP